MAEDLPDFFATANEFKSYGRCILFGRIFFGGGENVVGFGYSAAAVAGGLVACVSLRWLNSGKLGIRAAAALSCGASDDRLG